MDKKTGEDLANRILDSQRIQKPQVHGHISAGWEAYRQQVMGPVAPDNQVRDMGRTFYAGAALMLRLYTDLLAMNPRDRAVTIQGLHEEIRQSITKWAPRR
jgi:hypothetical protein